MSFVVISIFIGVKQYSLTHISIFRRIAPQVTVDILNVTQGEFETGSIGKSSHEPRFIHFGGRLGAMTHWG